MPRGTQDTPRALQDFAYGAITLFGRPFQTIPLSIKVSHRSPTTPEGIASRRFGHNPVSLAATQGVSIDFLSSGY